MYRSDKCYCIKCIFGDKIGSSDNEKWFVGSLPVYFLTNNWILRIRTTK